jgi:hypothetical protein
MADTQMPADACAASGPGPQHESIARFAGTWRAEVQLWMDPTGDPMVSHGTMTNQMIVGDRFLQQEYHDDAGMFEGRGFWGYNDVDKRYEGFWIDSMANFFQLERGQLNESGKVYEMRGSMTNPQTKQEMSKRSVITYLGPDEHTIAMYFGGEQGEHKAMAIHYKRA